MKRILVFITLVFLVSLLGACGKNGEAGAAGSSATMAGKEFTSLTNGRLHFIDSTKVEIQAKPDDAALTGQYAVQPDGTIRTELTVFGTTQAVYLIPSADGVQVKGESDFYYNPEALGRARLEMSKSAEHLKKLWNYVAFAGSGIANGGKLEYPQSLGSMYLICKQFGRAVNGFERMQAEDFVTPARRSSVPNSMSDQEMQAWIDSHSDYTFKVLGWSASSPPEKRKTAQGAVAAVGREKDVAAHNGVVNVIFPDGHIEVMTIKDADAAMTGLNDFMLHAP